MFLYIISRILQSLIRIEWNAWHFPSDWKYKRFKGFYFYILKKKKKRLKYLPMPAVLQGWFCLKMNKEQQVNLWILPKRNKQTEKKNVHWVKERGGKKALKERLNTMIFLNSF